MFAVKVGTVCCNAFLHTWLCYPSQLWCLLCARAAGIVCGSVCGLAAVPAGLGACLLLAELNLTGCGGGGGVFGLPHVDIVSGGAVVQTTPSKLPQRLRRPYAVLPASTCAVCRSCVLARTVVVPSLRVLYANCNIVDLSAANPNHGHKEVTHQISLASSIASLKTARQWLGGVSRAPQSKTRQQHQ